VNNVCRRERDASFICRVAAVLNQQLADTLDLYTQVKQAHWNGSSTRSPGMFSSSSI
jgi:DNA-binding ferritin-like protein